MGHHGAHRGPAAGPMSRTEFLPPYRYTLPEGCFPLGRDSLALGEFATVRPRQKVCDLGCGGGLLLLLLSRRAEGLALHGVELDPVAAISASSPTPPAVFHWWCPIRPILPPVRGGPAVPPAWKTGVLWRNYAHRQAVWCKTADALPWFTGRSGSPICSAPCALPAWSQNAFVFYSMTRPIPPLPCWWRRSKTAVPVWRSFRSV